jgi:hypothetical protein
MKWKLTSSGGSHVILAPEYHEESLEEDRELPSPN